MPKRALICGVSGQDGCYLADLLLQKGYQVWGSSRDAEISRFENLQYLGIRGKINVVSLELTDFRSIIQVLEEIRPTEIYNLAAQSSVSLSFRQPIETLESILIGTTNLLEAIRFLAADIRLYNAASGECFGECLGGEAASENSPFRPRSPYGVAKASAFWQVANYRTAYDLYACSGLLFNHESPLRPARFVTRKITTAVSRIANGSRERLSLGDVDIIRDWGWAPEYVEAMWLMLQRDTARDYVIATGVSCSLRNFVSECFSGVGLSWSDHVDLDPDLKRGRSEIRMSSANPSLARAELGWSAATTMPSLAHRLMSDEMCAYAGRRGGTFDVSH